MNPGTGSAAPGSQVVAWLLVALKPLALPASVLVVAWFLGRYTARLPASLGVLVEYGPTALLALAALLGAAFGRGKAMLAAALLLAGQGLVRWSTDQAIPAQITRDIAALTLYGLIPLNLALVSCYHERGITSVHGNFRLGIVVVQGIAVTILLRHPLPELARLLDRALLPLPEAAMSLFPDPAAQLSALALVAAALTIAIRAYWDYSPMAFALLGALCGHVLALRSAGNTSASATFISAAALLLSIAVLRQSRSMAYGGGLTGAPRSHALREQLTALEGRYTVAMIDIDRFRQFNDHHGHDVGEEVLRMVSKQISYVKGNGRAYRYSGEEFAVVFPHRSLDKALGFLEEVRERVAAYPMVIREPNRPPGDGSGAFAPFLKRGSFREASRQIAVTVSIGAAERAERGETPDDVLKRADEALYRAKRGGRNRVES